MDPLALLPFAVAAAGGRAGGFDVRALIAAGVTLLQRAAPLVRVLAGKRSALLVSDPATLLVGLAASDGRATLVLPATHPVTIGTLDANAVGAVFTVSSLRHLLPDAIPVVLLDQAPARAVVVIGGQSWPIDLGSHFGLDLSGDRDVDGAPEECVRFASGISLTHREVLHMARASAAGAAPHGSSAPLAWHDPQTFITDVVAPLLRGEAVGGR